MQGSRQDLYQCSTCVKTYTRIDHLARHVRSHTQEKPYECTVCQKGFTRADLLRRHQSVHTDRAPSSDGKRRRTRAISGRPARVSQACKACSENHLKCEDDKPCHRCTQKRIQCIPVQPSYHSWSRSNQPSAQVPAQTSELVEELRLPTPDTTDISNISSHETLVQHEPNLSPEIPTQFVPKRPHSESFLDIDDELQQQQLQPESHTPSIPLPSNSLPSQPPVLDAKDITFLSSTQQNIMPGLLDMNPYQSGTCTPGGLRFGLETDLDLSSLDLNFLNSFNMTGQFGMDTPTPPPAEVPDSTKEHPSPAPWSIWRFIPKPQDHGYAEQENLCLPDEDTPISRPIDPSEISRSNCGPLGFRERDKILSIIHRQLRPPLINAISAFPSAEMLDTLIQIFLHSPISGASSWIHIPTLDLKNCQPELLIAMSAAGAVLTPHASIQKMGFAIQEVLRHHLGSVFESNNAAIREIEILQSYLITLMIGMWSGNNRKIEISESFQQSLITMIRRRGMINRAFYGQVSLHGNEDGLSLEETWKSWAVQEAFKRLVFKALQLNTHVSITLRIVPLISYGEIDIPLPVSQSYWSAQTASDWKTLMLTEPSPLTAHIPSLRDCLGDMDLLEASQDVCDVQKTSEGFLDCLWCLAWEYQQLRNVLRGQPRYWDSGLVMNSRYQELMSILKTFRLSCVDESSPMWELIAMNLHISIDEIQIFCCTEDVEEANRLRTLVTQWAESRTGRRAVWHAGQIIRSAKAVQACVFSEFTGIAVYQASLALWAYSLVTSSNSPAELDGTQPSIHNAQRRVWIDEAETGEIPKFIELERGVPGIGGRQSSGEFTPLENRAAMIEVLVDILRKVPDPHDQTCASLPFIETLILLMEQWKSNFRNA